MTDYNTAYEIAKHYLKDINYCEEREDAYTFGNSNAEPSRGGLGAPCVVMKDDGSVHTYHQYMLLHLRDKMPAVTRTISI